jgi:hypothetical protein
MRPWEYKSTVERLRRMSGEETVRLGILLTEDALEILASSIHKQNPDIFRGGQRCSLLIRCLRRYPRG